MPWQEETTLSLKQAFIKQAANQETSLSGLCRRYQISRKTGYHRLKRYQEKGMPGWLPRLKWPLSSPDQADTAIELALQSVQEQEPT